VERHDRNLFSVLAGLVFVALGTAFLLDEVDALRLQARGVWPVLLIGLGVAGLASSRR
jgi:hypothetical protein